MIPSGIWQIFCQHEHRFLQECQNLLETSQDSLLLKQLEGMGGEGKIIVIFCWVWQWKGEMDGQTKVLEWVKWTSKYVQKDIEF